MGALEVNGQRSPSVVASLHDQVMDPKMDSGYLQPGEGLVDEYDLEHQLLPDEVIGIMDQFLCCEMAWHEGYPLAQTLFSSHYVDKLLSLEAKTIDQIHFTSAGQKNIWSAPLLHLVLRSFCIALIKCCDYALEEVNRSLDGGGTRSTSTRKRTFLVIPTDVNCSHEYHWNP